MNLMYYFMANFSDLKNGVLAKAVPREPFLLVMLLSLLPRKLI